MVEALSQTDHQVAGSAPLLAFDKVTKRFGGVTALNGVSMIVEAGEVVALLGENGAGKSTLIKLLAGIYGSDSGQILYRGAPYHHQPPRFGVRQPVAFIHQDLGLIEWMTIAENMALALGFPRRFGLIDWRAITRETRRVLTLVSCERDPGVRVRDLSRTEKALVAIARALAVEADVLVLDEPTASLPADEVTRLFAALRPLKARGVGIIYVSHRLDEVFEIADRIVVLRDGAMVGTRAVAQTSPHDLVALIIGKALAQYDGLPPSQHRPQRFEARNLAVEAAGPVSFTLRQGEIIGLVGLRGAGHERIGRALFGAEPYAGDLLIDGQTHRLKDCRAAMAAGIGLIARDRLEEAAIIGLEVRENLFVNPAALGRRMLHVLAPRREAEAARKIGARVGLRPNDPAAPIETFSGGNQQKIVVGRWLNIGCRILIAEDPTSGVDVGAKADIYRLMDEACQQGLGLIVVSTDFEEVARICHRALVFSRGTIVASLEGQDLTVERLVHAASVTTKAA